MTQRMRDVYQTTRTKVTVTSLTTVSTWVQVADENPDRTSLFLSQLGASSVFFSPVKLVGSGGVQTSGTIPYVQLSYMINGPLACCAWYAFSTTPGVNVSAVESITEKEPVLAQIARRPVDAPIQIPNGSGDFGCGL